HEVRAGVRPLAGQVQERVDDLPVLGALTQRDRLDDLGPLDRAGGGATDRCGDRSVLLMEGASDCIDADVGTEEHELRGGPASGRGDRVGGVGVRGHGLLDSVWWSICRRSAYPVSGWSSQLPVDQPTGAKDPSV